jgi:5-methylcytosine-specific restriction endonuclease McrA
MPRKEQYKIRIPNLVNQFMAIFLGKKIYRKPGRVMSLETRIKMSKANRGDKCYRWKGGITNKNKSVRNTIEFRLWREAVFARDNWTCQECGERGCYLEAHHIKSFASHPELRFAIDNGLTLCLECHKKTPNYKCKSEFRRSILCSDK